MISVKTLAISAMVAFGLGAILQARDFHLVGVALLIYLVFLMAFGPEPGEDED
jgi:hypothetical protein